MWTGCIHYIARPEIYKPQEANYVQELEVKDFNVNNFYNLSLAIPKMR